ncbi:hypothetical protein FRB97_005628 [Tulasnella sp. 331]|nr:hypothetical protein FRB97_005628 [Tulasnella sp. 331]
MSSSSEPNAVKYVRLGNSGLRVSVPILGCLSFGNSEWLDWVLHEDESMPILKAAWDRGINTFDTANNYSNGESEKILGKFIKMNNIPREKIIIMTKCWAIVGDTPAVRAYYMPELQHTRDYVNQSGLSRTAIFNAVEKSLERLGTSYIDLLQIHRHDPDTPAEETMCALNDLVRSGKVRYIGGSTMPTWRFCEYNHVAEKHGWSQFVSMQNEYNLIYREEEREMIPYCLDKGIGIIPWGPLSSGDLARPLGGAEKTPRQAFGQWREITESDKEVIRRVEALAKKYDMSMAQIAVAWLMLKISSPIIGMNSLARLEDAVPKDFKLTAEDAKSLEEPYRAKFLAL